MRKRHTPNRHRPPPGRRAEPHDDRLQRASQYSEALVMEPRSCGVLDTPHVRGMTVCCGAATRPSQLEERRRARPVVVETRRVARSSIRSVNLTIFWHCGTRHFSFRTAWERVPGNEPSMVLAEDARPKGSGNADSQPNVRSSGESGRCRSSRSDSGCVLAHPASWRASASYRPLRAVWADCAWALRGCARSPEPPQRSKQRALKGIFR
jgi:hypothetical protein